MLLQCQLANLKAQACQAMGLEADDYDVYDFRALEIGANVSWAGTGQGRCWACRLWAAWLHHILSTLLVDIGVNQGTKFYPYPAITLKF